MMILAIALAAATAAPADPGFLKAKSALLDNLRDPSRAQFRNWHLILSEHGPEQNHYCGEVNAPNAYGGMTGWHHFDVSVKGYVVEEDGGAADRRFFDILCPSSPDAPDLSTAFAPSAG